MSVSQEHDVLPSRIYIRIDEGRTPEKDFEIGIYNNADLVQEVNLEDIFTE